MYWLRNPIELRGEVFIYPHKNGKPGIFEYPVYGIGLLCSHLDIMSSITKEINLINLGRAPMQLCFTRCAPRTIQRPRLGLGFELYIHTLFNSYLA